ncbi:hypothetical protein [Neisseria musculi]|uniref:hypothetical protein n=1 Tax=Neisseria musculi TaxID=1815583 RepID=UPI0036728588
MFDQAGSGNQGELREKAKHYNKFDPGETVHINIKRTTAVAAKLKNSQSMGLSVCCHLRFPTRIALFILPAPTTSTVKLLLCNVVNCFDTIEYVYSD